MLEQKIEFTAIDSGTVVATLIEIGLDEPIYLVDDNVNWEFKGNTYQAFPFQLGTLTSTGKGEIQKTTLQVSNITGVIIRGIEQNGIDEVPVKVSILRAGEAEADIELNFEISGVTYTAENINIELTAPIRYQNSYPNLKYSAVCPWGFKDWRCRYSGSKTTCNRTISDCRERSNVARFGGFVNETA
jgi:phage-related protein